ncbi:MAG: response regulator [Butyrivibrio sp.]|jgi:DNA-binding response OmpR family regulator|nr:response regulator [Butyrivibrio sp.]
MDKRVLLIGSTKSFMVSAIAKGLEKEEYEVVSCEPSRAAVAALENRPSIYLLYLGDEVALNSDLELYLSEQIDAEQFVLYLIGTQREFEAALVHISRSKVTDMFLRPIDVKELAEQLDIVVRDSSVAEEQKKKILVIDDDGTMLRMIKTWLSVKYRVYMASTGKIAMSFLQNNTVDLVLLDYEMPTMNGPQVLKLIRANLPTSELPVMFLTSKSDKESVLSVANLKPEKYLLKTMPKNQLLGAIDDFFTKKSGV